MPEHTLDPNLSPVPQGWLCYVIFLHACPAGQEVPLH